MIEPAEPKRQEMILVAEDYEPLPLRIMLDPEHVGLVIPVVRG